MNIVVSFSGGKRVDAQLGERVIHTDQSPDHGGDGSAPEPFQLFLASLATCAGIYVLGFCQARGIATDGIQLVQRHEFDAETGRLSAVRMEISVPAGFPPKYVPALERVAAKCAVKRVLDNPPELAIHTTVRTDQPLSQVSA
jgi:putative redox protein